MIVITRLLLSASSHTLRATFGSDLLNHPQLAVTFGILEPTEHFSDNAGRQLPGKTNDEFISPTSQNGPNVTERHLLGGVVGSRRVLPRSSQWLAAGCQVELVERTVHIHQLHRNSGTMKNSTLDAGYINHSSSFLTARLREPTS